jgi:hypothetical protein
VNTEGLVVDDEKVEAISQMPDPKSKTEVRSIVGMINFVRDFVPDLSSTLAPLNGLLKDGVHFHFDANCKKALQTVLTHLSSKPVLQHHDPMADMKVVTDASKIGLGAVLMQRNASGKWLPVKYASRAVTPTEGRWAPIELELLEGPFDTFRGRWQFQALGDTACKLSLDLEFSFNNGVLGVAAGKLFDSVTANLVDALSRRARDLYG